MKVTKILMAAMTATMAMFFSSCELIAKFFPVEEEFDDTSKGTLVWYDDFNYTGVPDTKYWSYEEMYRSQVNNEAQRYVSNTDANRANYAFCDGKKLTIRAIREKEGWVSGRLYTKGKKDWKYGYVEAKIKLPSAGGCWPAFWMMPSGSKYSNGSYNGWPVNGEIDIMEYGPNITGRNVVYSTLHYGLGSENENHWYTTVAKKTVEGVENDYHIYGVDWTEGGLVFYYDNKRVGTYSKDNRDWTTYPFDQNYYIILNLAMGGNLGGKIDKNVVGATVDYDIDWVKVWKHD